MVLGVRRVRRVFRGFSFTSELWTQNEWRGLVSFNSPLLSTPSFQLVSTLLSEPLFFPVLFPPFNPLFPNLLFTLPTSLPSANVHTFIKVARPQSAAPMSAQSPSWVPGRDSTSMGIQREGVFRVLDSSAADAQSSTRSFKSKVEDEIEGSGGIDRGVADR